MKYVRTKRKFDLLQLLEAQRRGRVGATVKAAQWRPLKELAFQLAQKKRYLTRHAAARDIADDICAFAATLDIHVSKYHAPITIAGWLKEEGLVFGE